MITRKEAIIMACNGHKVEAREPGSRWTIIFQPVTPNRAREVALSPVGEIREGFLWTFNGDDIELVAEGS